MLSISSFERGQGRALAARLRERRRFLQVVTGARQVGKTTRVLLVGGDGMPLDTFLSRPVAHWAEKA